MKRILILLLLPAQMALGQQEVTLAECYLRTRENYPNLQQAGIWQEITQLKKDNLKTGYMPQISLNGQATYQSDVTKVDIALPNISIPTVSKDQYKAYAEFRQTIWDSGLTEANAQLEDALLKSHLSELEVELYKLNEQVAQAFFTALLVEKQMEVVSAQQKVLNEKLSSVESAIRNGMAEKTLALEIKAELLNLEQHKIQLVAAKNAAIQMLSILTGKTMNQNVELVFDEKPVLPGDNLLRPEQVLFSNQMAQLETQMTLLDKSRNPKLFGFGQAGYGKPGLNMLNNEFDTYYLVGVGLSWNVFDWNKTNRQKQVLTLQQEMIQKQEETFDQNIQLLLAQQKEQIGKLETILKTDQEMVELRTEITKSAASKLKNEFVTTTDYIRELQAETVAKLNLELHKIQLDEANEKYNLIKGNVGSGQSQSQSQFSDRINR
ncbi:TolC family protein [Mariniphaga sp.]|uniref:TolC family protein n=1 Tax=Mariniphaga sp. TaxID=1954475 RepID=UPI003569CC3E